MNEIPENEENEELEDGLVELIDDYGNILKFKLFGVTEYKGARYALLLAAEPNEKIADDEVVIFRFSKDGKALEPIEDEKFREEVFEFYKAEADEEDNEDELES